MLSIERVLAGGTAALLGLEAGDSIVSVNGEDVSDVIDFQFLAADERSIVTVRKKNGTILDIPFARTQQRDLGLELEPLRMRTCRNQCIFCFVDQMPSGCRKSLYVKDDDYRASFLYGNYITLCNLTEGDWARIFRQRLSPLYISVHTTDQELRQCILGNKRAPDIMVALRRLAAGGIRMHTQIVLCPGVNDGLHLTNTVEHLASLFPAVTSIAAVPVGLTSHRNGLFPVKQYSRRQARAVLSEVAVLGKKYKRMYGTRLVFASDEFYIKSGEKIPAYRFYEDFPQLENGVGMVAHTIRDAMRARLPSKIPPRYITVVTALSFSVILKSLLKRLEKIKGAHVRCIPVKNKFFGPSVTVTGLLAGRDVLDAVKGKKLGELLLIPSEALKEDEDVFLDGVTLENLEKKLNVRVRRVGGFGELVNILQEEGERAKKEVTVL